MLGAGCQTLNPKPWAAAKEQRSMPGGFAFRLCGPGGPGSETTVVLRGSAVCRSFRLSNICRRNQRLNNHAAVIRPTCNYWRWRAKVWELENLLEHGHPCHIDTFATPRTAAVNGLASLSPPTNFFSAPRCKNGCWSCPWGVVAIDLPRARETHIH